MITDIDYNILTRLLTPVRLRTAWMAAWFRVLLHPFGVGVYDRFKAWERKSWYDLKYQTGQVAYLEYVLNGAFDPSLKRIWIGNNLAGEELKYIFLDVENEDKYLFRDYEPDAPMWVFTDAEYVNGVFAGIDFVINVPLGLPYAETTVKALADRFKRDGKSYIINYF